MAKRRTPGQRERIKAYVLDHPNASTPTIQKALNMSYTSTICSVRKEIREKGNATPVRERLISENPENPSMAGRQFSYGVDGKTPSYQTKTVVRHVVAIQKAVSVLGVEIVRSIVDTVDELDKA